MPHLFACLLFSRFDCTPPMKKRHVIMLSVLIAEDDRSSLARVLVLLAFVTLHSVRMRVLALRCCRSRRRCCPCSKPDPCTPFPCSCSHFSVNETNVPCSCHDHVASTSLFSSCDTSSSPLRKLHASTRGGIIGQNAGETGC